MRSNKMNNARRQHINIHKYTHAHGMCSQITTKKGTQNNHKKYHA